MTRAPCHASPQRQDDRRAVDCLIDSGAGTFGDEAVLADHKKTAVGWAAPAGFDGNADPFDARCAGVRIRRDLNRNGGISQASEPQGLDSRRIPSDSAPQLARFA